MKKFGAKKIAILIIVLVVFGLACVAISVLPKLQAGTELVTLLTSLMERENQAMEVSISIDMDTSELVLESKVYVLNKDEETVCVIEDEDYVFYIKGDAIYLENGKGFKLDVSDSVETSTNENEVNADSFKLLEQIARLYQMLEITKTKSGEKTTYSVVAEGKNAKLLLDELVPSMEGKIVSAGKTQISVVVIGEEIESIYISGNATMDDEKQSEVEVEVVLSDFTELQVGDYEIPEVVKQAMENDEELTVFGEEMYHLLLAWTNFAKTEKNGTVTIDVSCGFLSFQNEHKWSSISKETSSTGESKDKDLGNLPDMMYEILLNGDFLCEQSGEKYVFTLNLDKDTMKNLAEIIAPEIKSQTVTLTSGLLETVVEKDEISSMTIGIEGSVKVLFSDVDASIYTKFEFE